ncbi:MAG: hypothetical protein K2R93_18910 [Gemmatimonadaceae bacterium]|nr:hypothetical protein [Gemmatimonadaceae bacterium]
MYRITRAEASRRPPAVIVLTAAILGAACTPTEALRPTTTSSTATNDVAQSHDASSVAFSISSLADISLEVKGEFRPNRPITVHAAVTALRDIEKGIAEFTYTSDDDRRRSANRHIQQRISVRRDSKVDLERTVSFAAPGYYSLSFVTHDKEPERLQTVSEQFSRHVASKTIWLLITDEGGRSDAEYRNPIASDSLQFLTQGTVGLFVRQDSVLNEWKRRQANVRSDAGVLAQKSLSSGPTFRGRITYVETIPAVGADSSVGVPNAKVTGHCSTVGGTSLGYWEVVADSGGAFSVDCPADAFSTYVVAYLSNESAEVNGYNNSWSGANGWISLMDFGLQVDLSVANNQAAHVFRLHQQYNEYAATLFGRSRSQLNWRASNSTAQTTAFIAASDYIRTHPDDVWGTLGKFIVTHEYGHAFHYVALEPWSTYTCGLNGRHVADSAYTASCAFVEGFADFYAARMRNVVEGSSGMYATLSQYQLEQNAFRTIGNGALIESAFAAFLLDLVDTSSDPDGISGDDDATSISHAQLAEIMTNCYLTSPSWTALTASDQFVYCAAGSVGERSYVSGTWLSSWGSYGGIGFSPYTSLPSQSEVRALWKYNFYNQ